jgi:hypothetical protein
MRRSEPDGAPVDNRCATPQIESSSCGPLDQPVISRRMADQTEPSERACPRSHPISGRCRPARTAITPTHICVPVSYVRLIAGISLFACVIRAGAGAEPVMADHQDPAPAGEAEPTVRRRGHGDSATGSRKAAGAASRRVAPTRHDRDSPRVAESRRAEQPLSPVNSNYASLDRGLPARGTEHPAPVVSVDLVGRSTEGPQIELPRHDPVITPDVARALLRLVLRTAAGSERDNHRQQPSPPGSSE